MYFLEQLKHQFINNLVAYSFGEQTAGGPDTVEKSADAPMTLGKANSLSVDAHNKAKDMGEKSAQLEESVNKLNNGKGDDNVMGKKGGNKLDKADGVENSKTKGITQAEKRDAIIAQLTEDGEFPEGMDEEARETLIQAKLTEVNNNEKPLTEEERQALDKKHQEILEYGRSLGLQGLDEEVIQNVFGDMTQEQIIEFEAMSPEEQTEFMLGKSETLMEANKQILAQREAELEAERSAGVSPERGREIAGEQRQIQSARNAISGNGPGNTGFFRGGSENAMMPGGEAGTLTPEQLAEFGPMGGEIAAYALTCEPATGEKSYCGKNTGEMLNSYYRSIGKPELQINDRPRHGYIWASLLANRPDQFKEISVTPQNAPVGCLISYAAGPGGSSPFAQYGHIETKCSENQYHFGQVASSPGGSKRPPQEGEYRVFMPISKTA